MFIVYKTPRIMYYLNGIMFLSFFCIFDRKCENKAQNNEDIHTHKSGYLNLSLRNSSPSLSCMFIY
jgi:hypothetical protein